VTDIRDVKRQVPMSEDMIHSRMIAVGVLAVIPLVVWLLLEAWEWIEAWAGA
jgi:hypothetical protein